MSFINVPDPVTNITHTTFTGSKSAEVTDLETHVIVCSLRYEAIEGSISRLENRVNEIILHTEANNKLIVRTLLTIGTGAITTFLATHFKFI